MTIAEAIAAVDRLKENQYSNEDKVRMLSDLDGKLMNIVFRRHEGNPYESWQPYDLYQDGGDTAQLLVPDPYSHLYVTFLSYNIDLLNGEYERYNNTAAVYNTELQDFISYWKREHLPLQKAKIRMG